MIRLKPTPIPLTMDDVKEYETRRRYRRYLELEDCRDKLGRDGDGRSPLDIAMQLCSASSAPLVDRGKPPLPLPARTREPLPISPASFSPDARDEGSPASGARENQEPPSHDGPDTQPQTADLVYQGSTRLFAIPPRRAPVPRADSRRQTNSPESLGDFFEDPDSSTSLPASSLGDVASVGHAAAMPAMRHANDELDALPLEGLSLQTSVSPDSSSSKPEPPPSLRQPARSASGSYLYWLTRQEHLRLQSTAEMDDSSLQATTTTQGHSQLDSFGRGHPYTLSHHHTGATSSTKFRGARLQSSLGHVGVGSSETESQAVPDVDGASSLPGHEAGDLHIYDDSLPASSQPQTPQNLPEARHRSRLLSAYTAPAGGSGRSSSRNRRGSRASAHRRDASPEGLSTPGFQGLYGGLENSDEAALFEEGVRRLREGRRGEASSRRHSPY